MTNAEYRAKLLKMEMEEFTLECVRAFQYRTFTNSKYYRDMHRTLWGVAKYKNGDFKDTYIKVYIEYVWGHVLRLFGFIGAMFAVLLTWNPDQGGWSMFWSTVHGMFGWFYVILHSFGVR